MYSSRESAEVASLVAMPSRSALDGVSGVANM